jgi:hypothetical protein
MKDDEQKKTEAETFEARIRALIHTEMVSESPGGHGEVLQTTERTILDGDINNATDLCREADQRIAALSAQLEASEAAHGLYAASVPIEADELIDFLEARVDLGFVRAEVEEHDRLLTRYEKLFKESKQSAPLELVGLLEELIDWIVGANSAPADPQLVIRAQATIERWKV